MHAPDPDVADVGLIGSVDMGVACETGRGVVCRQFQLLFAGNFIDDIFGADVRRRSEERVKESTAV